MIACSTSSRCARAERFNGSRCSALRRKYVDGAIGSSAQIDSTPWTSRWASMNATITSLGGRVPPAQNTPTPCARSHSRASAREPRAPALSFAAVRPSLSRRGGPCHAPPGGPSAEASHSCIPVSGRSPRSLPTATDAPARALGPAGLPVLELRERIVSVVP
jgi:hypothetical protein